MKIALKALGLTEPVVVLAASFLWFLFNARLPGVYRGQLIYDAIFYTDVARTLSIGEALTRYDYRPLGYPLFLRAHLFLFQTFGLAMPSDWIWIHLSLLTVFILFVCASYFLYYSFLRRGVGLHRVALYLLLLYPGLVASAALTMTDTFATVLVMVMAGCLLRLEWKVDRSNLLLAGAIGLLAGWLVITRPPHYVVVPAVLAVSLGIGVAVSICRWSWVFLLPVVAIVFCALIAAPRLFACYERSHTLCFVTPTDFERYLRNSLEVSKTGARIYGVSHLDGNGKLHAYQVAVPDPLFVSRFGCVLGDSPNLRGLFDCYARNVHYLPVYFGKKLIALFDNYHLNTFAAAVTTWWQIVVNRFFGVVVWVGFLGVVGLGVGQLLRRQLDLRFSLLLLYGFIYLGSILLVAHIEARYGFPLVPFSLFFFVAIFQWMDRARRSQAATAMATCLLAVVVFLWQVNAWDRADYLLNGGDPDVPPVCRSWDIC